MKSERTLAEWKAKGNAAFTCKFFDEAIESFSAAIELSPNDPVLYSNRSGAYASVKKFELALDDASKCISLKGDWSKGYSRKGFAQLQLGDVRGAIITYKEGIKVDPKNAALLDGLREAVRRDPGAVMEARLLMKMQSLLSTPKFKKYCDEDPSFSNQLSVMIQEILKDSNNLQIAMAMCPDPRLKEALTVLLELPAEEVDEDVLKEKRQAEARAKRAEEERIKREKEEAERVKSPEEVEGNRLKEEGNVLYKSRQFDQALEVYEKAIQTHPGEIIYFVNKAAVYLEMGQFDNCLAECQKALDKRYELRADYAKVAKVYNRMAVCYKRMGDLSQCIEHYEKSLTESSDRHVRAALADVKRLKEKKDKEDYINPELAEEHRLKGNEFFKSQDFPSAKHEYDEAIRRQPDDAKLYANRAAALMKLLDLPGALKDVDKSLELDPTVAKVWARKGNVHTLMKDFNKAMNAFQRGLTVDPNSTECTQGMFQTRMKIQENSFSDKVDEDQVRHAMADPEIQALLSDPQFRMTLSGIQEDPNKLSEALRIPAMAEKLQKLMAAGILKVA